MRIAHRALVALACGALSLLPASARAAGTMSGVVIDGFTGQPVVGVTLMIEGTDVTIASGLGGGFQGEVAAGTYSVVVSKDGFEPQRITEVVVAEGEVADFAVVLLPAAGDSAGALPAAGDAAQVAGEPAAEGAAPTAVVDSETGEVSSNAAFVGEITVTAEAATSTEAALLTERRNAAQISDSIGTAEMAKSTGSDAAEVVKRVTGISLQNDKYVYVRGLGERYSNTALNGSKIPSTEFERKVVPFDLFPSSLLEKIRVSKSYTVDKPGDFAAGFVELETLDFPLEQTAGVSFGVDSHSETSGEQFGRYGSGLGWSGDGGQPLPGTIPGERLVRRSPITGIGFSPADLEQFGEDLIGMWRGAAGEVATPWGGSTYEAPLDAGYSLNYGNTFGRIGLVLSGTYGNDSRTRHEERSFYSLSASHPSGIQVRDQFGYDFNTETVKKGMVANLAYRLSDNHHLKLRSMFNTLSFADTMFQEGFFSDLNSDVRNYRVNYKDQQVETYQLSGEHYLGVGELGSLLEWRASTSNANTEQDYRYTLYADLAANGEYELTDNSSSGFMFFNALEDTIDDFAVDWTSFLSGDTAFGSIKGGIAYTTTDRDFQGRRLRYKHRDVRGIDLELPPEQLFVESNIEPDRGFEIEETTQPTDGYVASQEIPAAYVQLDWSYNKWRLIGGVRYESSDITVQSRDLFKPDAVVTPITLEETDWLPSLGLVYRLNQNQNLRFTASQTVNRPEFRELAPFTFVDAVGSFQRKGNPNLVSATIASLDARWEWFPSASDVVAFSLFYKDFSDPIESVIVEAATQIETWQNAEQARNQGFEVELRRNLGAWSDALANLTVVLNYSYIDSQISLAPGSPNTNQERAMVGQPDQVGNFVVEWAKVEWGSSFRVLYNYTGEKVAFAGSNGMPDVVETNRGTVDLAFLQTIRLIGLDWKVKLSAENVTEEVWEFTQGGELWQSWQPGAKYGFSLGLTLF